MSTWLPGWPGLSHPGAHVIFTFWKTSHDSHENWHFCTGSDPGAWPHVRYDIMYDLFVFSCVWHCVILANSMVDKCLEVWFLIFSTPGGNLLLVGSILKYPWIYSNHNCWVCVGLNILYPSIYTVNPYYYIHFKSCTVMIHRGWFFGE